MRRMDRYNEDNNNSKRSSRLDKNQELYQNLSSNSIYTNITDVTNANAYELDSNASTKTRESYQQLKKFQKVEPLPKSKKELDDFKFLYQKKENKIYDINSVLEEARKKRVGEDNLEEKRKLKNNDYNILAGINKKELDKYREEKKKRLTTPEEDEIRDLVDTIATKTLAGEIDKDTTVDLLSDLLATGLLDRVDNEEDVTDASVEIEKLEDKESKEKEEPKDKKEEAEDNKNKKKDDKQIKPILDEKQIKELEEKEEKMRTTGSLMTAKDPDFYTRSMDLSDKDFELGSEYRDKKLPIIVKIIIIILILALIAGAGYFIYLKMF